MLLEFNNKLTGDQTAKNGNLYQLEKETMNIIFSMLTVIKYLIFMVEVKVMEPI
jgi:hypothetical protein